MSFLLKNPFSSESSSSSADDGDTFSSSSQDSSSNDEEEDEVKDKDFDKEFLSKFPPPLPKNLLSSPLPTIMIHSPSRGDSEVMSMISNASRRR